MNTHEFKNTLRENLGDSTTLSSWATTLYSRVPLVLVGVDERNTPGEEDCPFVEIVLPGKDVGLQPAKSYYFIIACAIHDDGEVVNTNPNIRELAGIDRIEDFREQVKDIFQASLPANTTIKRIFVENSDIDEFPFFYSVMNIEIEELFVTGSNPYE